MCNNIDNENIGLCDYGCGQPAKYIFKNGKKCCSENHRQCPSVINKWKDWYYDEEFMERKKLEQENIKYLKAFLNTANNTKTDCFNDKRISAQTHDIQDYLNNKYKIKPDRLKKYLYSTNLKEVKCEKCGITTEYNGLPINLQLHHKDGNHYNNNLDNLEILCPNCHSQTDNFCSKNSSAYKYSYDEKLLTDLIRENLTLSAKKIIDLYNKIYKSDIKRGSNVIRIKIQSIRKELIKEKLDKIENV